MVDIVIAVQLRAQLWWFLFVRSWAGEARYEGYLLVELARTASGEQKRRGEERILVRGRRIKKRRKEGLRILSVVPSFP